MQRYSGVGNLGWGKVGLGGPYKVPTFFKHTGLQLKYLATWAPACLRAHYSWEGAHVHRLRHAIQASILWGMKVMSLQNTTESWTKRIRWPSRRARRQAGWERGSQDVWRAASTNRITRAHTKQRCSCSGFCAKMSSEERWQCDLYTTQNVKEAWDWLGTWQPTIHPVSQPNGRSTETKKAILGDFIDYLVQSAGIDKYRLLLSDPSFTNASMIYRNELFKIINEFESKYARNYLLFIIPAAIIILFVLIMIIKKRVRIKNLFQKGQ